MQSNSQIAKNTIFLYIRLGVSMVVSLYTSRVVLNALGVEDFGIFGVIGGLVSMFLFLNNALSTSTSRFLTYAIGENDNEKLNNYFNASIIIHLFLGLIIFVACETIGLWFLNNKLVIPSSKMDVANVVFHLSILTAVIPILIVPFNSLIIAYEKMDVFAYLSISDTVFKLLIAWAIPLFAKDRLAYYALMILCVSCINAFFYIVYSRRKFTWVTYSKVTDRTLYKSMVSFSSWSLFGNVASVCYNQGLNILLNMFFGPVVNAARSISLQVEQTLRNFTVNFQTAINPRIIKSYAQKDLGYMHTLIYASSKYSYFLLLLMSLPIIYETDIILKLWLKTVPDYTSAFMRIMLVIVAMETMANSIMTSVVASGKIKKYHTIVGTTLMMILPFSYFALKLTGNPISVFVVYAVIEVVACVLRLLIVKQLINLSIRKYLKESVFKCLNVTILSIVLPSVIYVLMPSSFLRLCLVTFACLFSVICSIYFLGLNESEKNFVKSKINQILHKK